ncbi:uncharacterized protein LOC122503307 [Leptopilina heterotoma]|uniref:uncharacterized protein LOC122503307 n=1 Tax=Leptopilina heterotoma TaxID=63436 RepID=UPI001CA9B78E|nr:uncharacterized protein LOC122503307 [Leptopilina heterotoma]
MDVIVISNFMTPGDCLILRREGLRFDSYAPSILLLTLGQFIEDVGGVRTFREGFPNQLNPTVCGIHCSRQTYSMFHLDVKSIGAICVNAAAVLGALVFHKSIENHDILIYIRSSVRRRGRVLVAALNALNKIEENEETAAMARRTFREHITVRCSEVYKQKKKQ